MNIYVTGVYKYKKTCSHSSSLSCEFHVFCIQSTERVWVKQEMKQQRYLTGSKLSVLADKSLCCGYKALRDGDKDRNTMTLNWVTYPPLFLTQAIIALMATNAQMHTLYCEARGHTRNCKSKAHNCSKGRKIHARTPETNSDTQRGERGGCSLFQLLQDERWVHPT